MYAWIPFGIRNIFVSIWKKTKTHWKLVYFSLCLLFAAPFPAHFPVHSHNSLTVFFFFEFVAEQHTVQQQSENIKNENKKSQFYHNKLFNYEKQMVGMMMCECVLAMAWRKRIKIFLFILKCFKSIDANVQVPTYIHR